MRSCKKAREVMEAVIHSLYSIIKIENHRNVKKSLPIRGQINPYLRFYFRVAFVSVHVGVCWLVPL